MIETPLPLAPERWATLPTPDPPSLLEQLATLRLENAALQAEIAGLHERVRELEARLTQYSSASSRPPSTDLPQPRRARRCGLPDGNGAGNPDTAVHSVPCCRSSRW